MACIEGELKYVICLLLHIGTVILAILLIVLNSWVVLLMKVTVSYMDSSYFWYLLTISIPYPCPLTFFPYVVETICCLQQVKVMFLTYTLPEIYSFKNLNCKEFLISHFLNSINLMWEYNCNIFSILQRIIYKFI